MHESKDLERIGSSAAEAFTTQADWLHRRVEVLSFPSRGDPIVRRRVSIDFSIPKSLGPLTPTEEGEKTYYVPVSVLRKWPPVLRLDLRDDGGEPIPLLTSVQNGVVDSALLRALAQRAVGDATIPNDVQVEIDQIARGDSVEARAALLSLLPPESDGALDAIHGLLRGDHDFVDTAGGLVDQTVLWLRVRGHPGERKIAKFAYDTARRIDLPALDPASFGMRALSTEVAVPHIGNAGSYHLTIASPAPLDIVDTELSIRRSPALSRAEKHDELIGRSTAVQSREAETPLEHGDLRLYSDAVGRQARAYVAGDRTGCYGTLWVSIAVQKGGFLLGASLAACLVALLMIGYGVFLEGLVEDPGAAATVLALVPPLLAYLVVRPGDHLLAREFLSGTRWFLLVSGLLPVVGAVLLAISSKSPGIALTVSWWVLAALAVVIAVVLVGGAVLPIRAAKRLPLSEGHE